MAFEEYDLGQRCHPRREPPPKQHTQNTDDKQTQQGHNTEPTETKTQREAAKRRARGAGILGLRHGG